MKARLLQDVKQFKWNAELTALSLHIKTDKKQEKNIVLNCRVLVIERDDYAYFFRHLKNLQTDISNHHKLLQFVLHIHTDIGYHELSAHVMLNDTDIKVLFIDSIYSEELSSDFCERFCDAADDFKEHLEIYVFKPKFNLQKSGKECQTFAQDFCLALCDQDPFHHLKMPENDYIQYINETNTPSFILRVYRSLQDGTHIDTLPSILDVKNIPANRKGVSLFDFFQNNLQKNVSFQEKVIDFYDVNNIYVTTKLVKLLKELDMFLTNNDESHIQYVINTYLIKKITIDELANWDWKPLALNVLPYEFDDLETLNEENLNTNLDEYLQTFSPPANPTPAQTVAMKKRHIDDESLEESPKRVKTNSPQIEQSVNSDKQDPMSRSRR